MRGRILPTVIFALLALAIMKGSETPACGQMTREAAIVDSATDVLNEIVTIKERGIPMALLRDAQGIAIFPGVIKAGFIIGGRHGNGVVMARKAEGTWSHPVFLTMTGGSIGWQAGAQATDVVLLFKSRKSVYDFIQRPKITLGVDAAIAAGPLGRQAEASTDLKFKAEILSYSRSRGLFAGASIEGAGLKPNDRFDSTFYVRPFISVGEILKGEDFDGIELVAPAAAGRLERYVSSLTGTPVPPPPAAPPGAEPGRLSERNGMPWRRARD
jgi:lipid-binding SYLF domain-containing protein